MNFMRILASSPSLALDRFLVRWTGYSLLNRIFASMTGTGYNQPLLLQSRGAKSGQWRSAVLPYFKDGDRYVIVGSRGGMPTDPAWAVNLRAHPEAVVYIKRRRMAVTAYVSEGEERARLWEMITRDNAVYISYQQRAQAHRQLPVVVLTPNMNSH